MSRTVYGTSCWECSDFNIKNTMGEECESNKHIFCDKSLMEHDAKIREDVILECINILAKSEDTILTDKQYYTLMDLVE